MKKSISIIVTVALIFGISIAGSAQEAWVAKSNPTVDSIKSQYKEKYIAPKASLTIADIFPVIGQFESTTNGNVATVSITIDPENKGLAWIEGLPQGRVKAMLRKSPATYKIPAQKTDDGKDVAEGTLIFDKELNTLNICIGKEYNSADPLAAFTPAKVEETITTTKKAKTKKVIEIKPWFFTGTKIEIETVMN